MEQIKAPAKLKENWVFEQNAKTAAQKIEELPYMVNQYNSAITEISILQAKITQNKKDLEAMRQSANDFNTIIKDTLPKELW